MTEKNLVGKTMKNCELMKGKSFQIKSEKIFYRRQNFIFEKQVNEK